MMLICNRRILWVIVLSFFVFSCNSDSVGEKELYKYLNNEGNGLRKEIKIGRVNYQITYWPDYLLALNEFKASGNKTMATWDSLKNTYSKNMYLKLSVEKDNKEIQTNYSSENEYSLLINKLTFGISDNISIKSSKGKDIDIIDFHTPRTYGVSQGNNILLILDKIDRSETFIKVTIKDFLGGFESSSIIINMKDIDRIPIFNPLI